jgi:aspartokinase-like uncharacterized kinase
VTGRRDPTVVVKVGGSLGVRPRALRRLVTMVADLARRHRLVVVPGGGRLADEVRRLDARYRPGDSAAHWMAVLAMDQFAFLLAGLAGGGAVVRDPAEIAAGRLNVVAPFDWMRRTDPLPHSWSVTSDSIAAWMAGELAARLLVLLKSVDGVPDRGVPARPRRRARPGALAGVVDAHFPRALDARVPCWIVNGGRPERVVELVERGWTYGTEVVA